MFISHKVFSIVLAACIALCVVFQRNNIGNIESSTSSPPVVNSRRFLKSTLWDLHSDLDKSYVERKVRENYDLEKAKIYAQELLDLMYNRYELYNEEVSVFFFTAWNFGNDAFNVYKYRFARKIMEGNARYLMTFGGSSVTAGHDGKLNSSFPMIAEKRLRPIMEALGIDFEVDNIAQATNNCIPYGLCYESMGKINPDFVGWEQSYNCGHDTASFEMTGRVAGMSAAHGSVWYSASGGFHVGKKLPSEFDPPYCDESWTVDSVKAPHAPLKHWYPTEADVQAMKDKLNQFHVKSPVASRFAKKEYWKVLGVSGFNIWNPSPLCHMMKDGKEKVGCAAPDIAGSPDIPIRFFSKEADKYDNPRGGGAAHHPPRAFHMWRGEAIAFAHALSILDAIFMIEKDLKAGKTHEELFKEYTEKFSDALGPLPEPISCDNDLLHCKHRPTCYTNYAPHFSVNKTLDEVIVGKSTWVELGVPGDKPYHQNKDIDGDLYLKIVPVTQNYVQICGALGESLKHTTFMMDLHAAEDETKDLSTYSFEGRDKNAPPLIEWKDRRYFGAECTTIQNVPVGKHILGIQRNTTLKRDHVNSVIHVITW